MPKKNSTNEPRPVELELAGIATVLRQICEALKLLDKHLTELIPPLTPRQSGPIPGPHPFLASQWKRQDGNVYSAVGTRNESTNADDPRGNLRPPVRR